MMKNPSHLQSNHDRMVNHLKTLIQKQVEDAEANFAFAEKRYRQAEKELETIKASYAQFCASVSDENKIEKYKWDHLEGKGHETVKEYDV
ncbi:hypothetical protein [Shouchella clausii]|nr:hypothetical protein [Shouchella clausii]